MKSTSQIFTFLSIIFFYSNSFPILFASFASKEEKLETLEQKKEAEVKKICSKLRGYKKLILVITRTVYNYYQLGQNTLVTYANKFQVEDYNSPERCKIVEAHIKFKETEITLIDEELLPSLKSIKKSIKALLKQIKETPDEEKDINDYTTKKYAIRCALCITLQNVEKYILQIADVIGVRDDVISQIGDSIGLTSKSNYSPHISPNSYYRAIAKLTDEIKDKVEDSILVNSNLNPVQKLIISARGFFKHPVFGQLSLYGVLASLLMELVLLYQGKKNSAPKGLSLAAIVTSGWSEVQSAKISHQVMFKDSSLFEKALKQVKQSTHASQFTELEQTFTSLNSDFNDLYKKLTCDKELSKEELLMQFKQDTSTFNAMKEKVTELNEFKKKIYSTLEAEKLKLEKAAQKKSNPDKQALIDSINTLTSTEQNTDMHGQALAEALIQKNLHSFKDAAYRILLETISLALLLKKIVTYSALVIKTLGEIHKVIEKIFFPDEKSKAYLTRAKYSTEKFDHEQKNIVRKLTLVDKVLDIPIIGWAKTQQKVRKQLSAFINPLTPERRDNKKLFRPLLITGQPGNGKTVTAIGLIQKCAELGVPTFSISPEVIPRFETFVDMLKQESFSVVFIDELQRLIKDKPYFQTVLLGALTELTDKVWFILVANKPEDLPYDLWRRCNRLECGLPKHEERLEALNKHLQESKHTCSPDIEELFLCFTEGMNFDDIFNILAVAKTVLHKQRQTQITEKALKKGIQLVYSYKLQAIAFDPRLSRDDLLDEFAYMPYSVFEKCIEEWNVNKHVISKEEIESTLAKHGYSRLPAHSLVATK